MKALKIGIVCPYGWDTPGGVQIHIRELTEYLIAEGHEVSVFAPVADESRISDPWLVSAGRPIAIPFNGAVARILFGPVASSRIRQWIANGDFDLLHLHEPGIPSLSLLACWVAEGPMVGTFHASSPRQKAVSAVGPILEPVLEKLSARIAVSEMARQTLKDRFETEAVVIPNGIDTGKFANPTTRPEWRGEGTIGFIGRFEEPRKGLQILLQAFPKVLKQHPKAKLLIAGPGDASVLEKWVDPALKSQIRYVGELTEEEKVEFFHTIDLYVAPNTGGESFGIILAEAMASQTAIVASDIPAFAALLGNGEFGSLFPNEDAAALATAVSSLLSDSSARSALANAGFSKSKTYDWQTVADQILDVYEMVLVGNDGVKLGSENRVWNRKRGSD